MDAPGETWSAVQNALKRGHRGLSGGTTLPQLLAEHCEMRHNGNAPPLSEEQILRWADGHHQRTGQWPRRTDGPILEESRETWYRVDAALKLGHRGLQGGRSLASLLEEKRGVPHRLRLPPLSVRWVLAWADVHHQRTGRWPNLYSGPIPEAPGETWDGVNRALRYGRRGLPGGISLSILLTRHGRRDKNRLRTSRAP